MESTAASANSNLSKKKRLQKFNKKVFVIIVGILVVIALALYWVRGILQRPQRQQEETHTVTRDNITVTISGSGVIEPLSEREIVPQAQGEVLTAPFEIGDTVSKDQILFTIDTKNVTDSVAMSRNALERSQMTYRQSLSSLNDLTTTAPFDGVVSASYVKEGDTVQAGTPIADVIKNDEMKLTVPFLASDTDALVAGQQAEITVAGTYYKLTGRVTGIPDGSFVNAQNVLVKNVEILVQNPGGIGKGQTATAIIDGYACNEAGTFDYAEEQTVVSKGAGTVTFMACSTGDVVKAGQTILQLENDSLRNSVEQNAYAVRDAELSLNSSERQLDNYVVRSPISGTVITKDVKPGDVLSSGMTKTVMATIADLSVLTFDINVDELDIAKVQVGQSVVVTADALPDRTYAGHVESISIKGTSANGVTTYPVTVRLDEKDGLMPGMNVNADIVIETRSNVIVVPVTAVQRGDTIAVKDDGSHPASADGAQQNASDAHQEEIMLSNGDPLPEGFMLQKVELGVNDADNVEILSGLAEGDEILVPTQRAAEFDPMAMMMMGARRGGDDDNNKNAPQGGGNAND